MDTLSNYMFDFSLPVDKSVDMLGVMYASPSDDSEAAAAVLTEFVNDFDSKIWLSYRTDFPSLCDKNRESVEIISDAGWGCSIRVTQMLIAQSLVYLSLGRDWRLSSGVGMEEYQRIVALFLDDLSAPLSIHNMVRLGHQMFNKRPSEWFGPTSGARVIDSLIASAPESQLAGVGCITFDGGEIYSPEVVEALHGKRGLMVLMTHRIGIDSIDLARYKGTILSLFACPFFQGLSSGESIVSAYFFVAASDEWLYYLDPHTVQPALTVDQWRPNPQPKPLKMRWQRLNPSLTFGFAVKSAEEWTQLSDYLRRLDAGLFEISEKPREERRYSVEMTEEDDMVILEDGSNTD